MNIKNKKVTVIDLEYSPYKEVLAIQEKLFNQIIAVKRANRVRDKQELTNNYLLWAEHAPVFTLGKSGKIEHLLLNEQGLKEKGIEYYSSSRGGDITFHGPGQIVGYPIFDLDNFFTDIPTTFCVILCDLCEGRVGYACEQTELKNFRLT